MLSSFSKSFNGSPSGFRIKATHSTMAYKRSVPSDLSGFSLLTVTLIHPGLCLQHLLGVNYCLHPPSSYSNSSHSFTEGFPVPSSILIPRITKGNDNQSKQEIILSGRQHSKCFTYNTILIL